MTVTPIIGDDKAFKEGRAMGSPQARAGNAPGVNPQQLAFFDHPGSFVVDMARTDDEIPGWWSPARDKQLRHFLRKTPIVSGVAYGEVTRVKNQEWVIASETGDIDEVKKWHEIFSMCDFGEGFAEFCGKFALALLTQDNGVFIELIDGTDSRKRTERPLEKTQIKSFSYLDPAQCWRTYDPEYPVVYVNPWTGEKHVYHHSRIIARSPFDQGYELGRGVGFCALSRTLQEARIARETGVYLYEKITGQDAEIIFVSGMGQPQLNAALANGEENISNRSGTLYKGVHFIAQNAFAPNIQPITTHPVGLKSVPDGWDRNVELTLAIYCIALGFGLDAREIWPATQSGATKADAEVQHRKASAKGRADIMRALETAINHRILPPGVTFRFTVDDEATQLFKARVSSVRANTVGTLIDKFVITPQQGAKLLAAAGDIPREFVPETMDEQITDLPEAGIDDVEEDSTPGQRMPQAGSQPKTQQPQQPQAQGQKEIGPSESFFRTFLLELISSAKTRSYLDFLNELQAGIRLFGEQAFVDGVRQAGLTAALGRLPDSARNIFARVLQEQQLYALGLARDVYEAEDTAVFATRIEMWVNKGLGEFYNRGLLADQQKRYRWWLGPTEHCSTCLAMAGQVQTAADLEASGIYPRSSALECGGFHCQCYLEQTDDPVSGQIPGYSRGRVNPFVRFLRGLGLG